MKNKKLKPPKLKIKAHGAVKSLDYEPPSKDNDHRGWVYFGATAACGVDYPVIFKVEQLPALIKELQRVVDFEDQS